MIPSSLTERTRLRDMMRVFAKSKSLVPPIDMVQLRELTREFIDSYGVDEQLNDWLMVGIHNSVWEDTVAGIPYDRRLLLLPKCLSHSKSCEGEIDELGLLCHQCGRCVIPDLQDYADRLGVLSIVAEGFTSVIELIENQVVDAVIGVSCLDSLEKAFPLLVNHAVPGIAIPLNVSGCHDTTVDVEYVKRLLPMHSDRTVSLIKYDAVREKMKRWFDTDALQRWFPKDDATACMALEWLTADGKRWRPFLLTAVYQALTGNEDVPEEVQMAAIAIECFHKASLVHDDIQDGDEERYGQPTVYAKHGTAIAINVGDYLLGMGYKLLAGCGNQELIQVIADAHISLCVGQGRELICTHTDKPAELSLQDVIDIFRYKTVPAFQVALELGLICAGGGKSPLRNVLKDYSEALGIAYQLNDDIDDDYDDTTVANRPSAIYAYRKEHPEKTHEEVIDDLRSLSERYHQDALNILGKVQSLELKRLLFQTTEKIRKR